MVGGGSGEKGENLAGAAEARVAWSRVEARAPQSMRALMQEAYGSHDASRCVARREISFSVSCSVKANHQRRVLASMGEPAKGMERTSTFAGMWRAEASRRGGGRESRAMGRRGEASAAVNCSRWRLGDRAENGCARVPVGSGAREGPTHGVRGGGRTVDGCGRRLWCGMGEGGVGRGWAGGGKE